MPQFYDSVFRVLFVYALLKQESCNDILEMGRQMDLNIVGVFSKDRLPKDYQVGSYYINLENSNEGNGTHWAYAEIFDDGKALYFDPFGTLAPIEVKDCTFCIWIISTRYQWEAGAAAHGGDGTRAQHSCAKLNPVDRGHGV